MFTARLPTQGGSRQICAVFVYTSSSTVLATVYLGSDLGVTCSEEKGRRFRGYTTCVTYRGMAARVTRMS
jgi:hypothetical protein